MNQNQTTGRNYAEVGQSGSDNQRWEPQKNIGNTQYPTQIEGYFKKFTELPGKNPGTTFHVAEIQMVNPDGSLAACIDVSGGKVLEEKLRVIHLGSFIMIQFKGKVQGKLNAYNDWATFVDEGAVPLHQLMGVQAPTQQQQTFQQPVQAAPQVQQQAPAFGQPQQAAPVFGNPAPIQNASFGNPAPTQNAPAPVFGGGQATGNVPPAFGQPVQQNAAPAFNQAQGGQMPGVPAGTNPFGNQAGGDLPF